MAVTSPELLLRTVVTHPFTGARSAEPMPFSVPQRVRFVERVAIDAMRLSSKPRGECFAAKQVDSSRYRLKMGGVDARSVTASMVQFHSIGDGANHKPIRNDVGVDILPSLFQPERAIPFVVASGGPHPAVSRFINLRPEPFDVSRFHSGLQA